MLTVEEALRAILNRCAPQATERTPLLEALGRVLAEEVTADIDMPPFDNSAVDGYAVRAADTSLATEDKPIALATVADIPAGVVPEAPLQPGCAARIMTGAMIPPDADAIVMLEDARVQNDGTVMIFQPAGSGEHVRRAGGDIRRGEAALAAGATLRSAEIAMLATVGRTEVVTYRSARVAILTTGDEVVEIVPGHAPPPGKIRNSNRYALAALAREAGGIVHSIGHVIDDLEATCQALGACVRSEADMIVCAGGVSVGDRDYVKPALERLGSLELWRIAIKPGKPLAFGAIGRTLFFGLPGNPVSAMVTFELFVRPALRKIAGFMQPDQDRRHVQARLLERIEHDPGRREYVRAVTVAEGSGFVTRPTGSQGSGLVHSMARANSFIVVPEAAEALEIGEMAEVRLLD